MCVLGMVDDDSGSEMDERPSILDMLETAFDFD